MGRDVYMKTPINIACVTSLGDMVVHVSVSVVAVDSPISDETSQVAEGGMLCWDFPLCATCECLQL